MLRVALCQVNLMVGDLDGNVEVMARALKEAETADAHVACFPELGAAGYPPEDLVLNEGASGPILDYLYTVQFSWTHDGTPVEDGSVVFRINHGNLIQVGQEYISPAIAALDPNPSLSADTARQNTGRRLRRHVGGSVPGGTPREKVVTSGGRGRIAS